ncbi:MAG: OmpA family protein [Elusimicrobia bacterium]|nr:OmpA family protein [Elusimicrobiota bacterium]
MTVSHARFLPALALLGLGACSGARLERQTDQIQIIGLQAQAASLAAQVDEKSDQAASLAAAKDALEAKNSELQGRIAELESRAAAAEGRIADLVRSNQVLSDSVKAAQGELGAKLSAALADKDELAKKLAEALKQAAALERQRSSLRAAGVRAAEDLGKLREERARLARRVAQHDAARAAAASASASARARAHEQAASAAEALLADVQAGFVSIDERGDSFALVVPGEALFEEGSAKPSKGGAALLGRVGAALKALPAESILVEAHAEGASVHKNLLGLGFESAWDLAAARAAAAARWLQEGGLDPSILGASGVGASRPAAREDSPAHRVEFIVRPAAP